MTRDFTFKLRNDYAALRALCRAAADFAEAHSLPDSAAYAVVLALEELISNVIKYGYDDDAPHEIGVRMTVEPDHLSIAVEDDGREFDPTSVPAPDVYKPLEQRRVGGVGIHLVRNVCESIAYRRDAGRNMVEIRIRFDPEAAEAGRRGTRKTAVSG